MCVCVVHYAWVTYRLLPLKYYANKCIIIYKLHTVTVPMHHSIMLTSTWLPLVTLVVFMVWHACQC